MLAPRSASDPLHRRDPAGHLSTPAPDPGRTPLPQYAEDPVSRLPKRGSRPPAFCLPPRTPSHRVPPAPRSPPHTRTSRPPNAGLRSAPTFPSRSPGPRSSGDSASRAETGGRARVPSAPARPAGTSCARDPLGAGASAVSAAQRRSRRGGNRAVPAPAPRPGARAARAAPCPPARGAAHLLARGRPLCREYVAVAAAARAPRLSSRRPRGRLRRTGPQRQAPSAAGKPHALALTLTRRPPRPAPPPASPDARFLVGPCVLGPGPAAASGESALTTHLRLSRSRCKSSPGCTFPASLNASPTR